jgi:flagellar motor protein MotB
MKAMAHKPKPKMEQESGEGAPLWIISFADMMSLLMAFFVMLSTFSGFGRSAAERLEKTVQATLRAQYGGWQMHRSRTAMGSQPPAAGQLEKGSEKPTLQDTQGKGLMKETQAGDFRQRKIFLIESAKVFWGTGVTVSSSGRDFLDTLASFASKLPDRLVISESGPGPDHRQGLVRAIGVLNYLTRKGVSKDRCSIAPQGMSPDHSADTQRMLEIALLNRGAYE